MDSRFIGIDGCHDGWLCAILDRGKAWSFEVVTDSDALFSLVSEAQLTLIDIPIGLLDSGREERRCDIEARLFLGWPRRTSVFPAPCRSVLGVGSYPQALAINREKTGRGLSKQSFLITPKIKQIDELLRVHPGLQDKFRECHPEICFQVLNDGEAMVVSKKRLAGREARISVIERYFPEVRAFVDEVGKAYLRRSVAWDDIVDALVAAVVAKVYCLNLATLPDNPPVDSCGLRMEMVVPGPE